MAVKFTLWQNNLSHTPQKSLWNYPNLIMFYFKKEKKILLPILDLSMKPLRLLVTKTMARYKHIDSTFNKYIKFIHEYCIQWTICPCFISAHFTPVVGGQRRWRDKIAQMPIQLSCKIQFWIYFFPIESIQIY